MPPSGGRGGCGRGRYPCNLRNSTLWRLRRKGERVRGGAARGGSPGFFTFEGFFGVGAGRPGGGERAGGGYSFGAWRIQIRGLADTDSGPVYRPARDTASGANVWRAPVLLATHSGPERVATCAGYNFGCECVAAQRARRGSAVRVFGPHRPRYRPYFATACRMRAPHGTQMAARKPTVAAPCRQSHGRPAAYAATTVGQVMGST